MPDTPSTRRGFLLAASTIALATPAYAQGAGGHGHQGRTLSSTEKEQAAFPFLSMRVFVEIDSRDTGGAAAVLRIFVPPGQGAPPHIHSREDEVFSIVRGRYRFRHGDTEVDAPAGTIVFLKRGEPHTFRNVSDEPGEHTVTVIPGGLENFFREVSDNQVQLPRDSAKLAEIGQKYGLTHLPLASLPLSTER
jgi:mannose-6-phosphate isomerase-like protein (cupin superfamily)